MQGKTLAIAVKQEQNIFLYYSCLLFMISNFLDCDDMLLKCIGVDKRKEESFLCQDVEGKDEKVCEE